MIAFLLFFTVILGALLSRFYPLNPRGVTFLLSFSGAFLLATTLVQVLPLVYHTKTLNIGLWMLIGVLLQILLEFLSKGAEHGHFHAHSKNALLGLVIGLFMHAFVEGLPLHEEGTESLLWAILLHKLPVAILIGSALYGIFKNSYKWYAFVIAFACMSPFGLYLGTILGPNLSAISLAIVAGMLLHVSTIILFEINQSHKFNLRKLLAILLGFGFALLVAH